jgi:hypothetical protein
MSPSRQLLAHRADFPRQFSRKKAQELSVLPAKDFRAPIGALQVAFALRLFAPFCGQNLCLIAGQAALSLGEENDRRNPT